MYFMHRELIIAYSLRFINDGNVRIRNLVCKCRLRLDASCNKLVSAIVRRHLK